MQPRGGGGGGGGSAEATAAALAARLASTLPREMRRDEAVYGALGKLGEGGKVDVGSLSSLQLVLLHELERFNSLLLAVSSSLAQLQLAIDGKVLMSAELEAMLSAMLRGVVPATWARAAYPSLKPLASWHADLIARVTFVRGWLIADGPPDRFILPYFFLPQGFLTGVLQMHARKHRTPIDHLSFAFTLLDEPSPEAHAAAKKEDAAAQTKRERRATVMAASGAGAVPPSEPPSDAPPDQKTRRMSTLDSPAASSFTPAPPPDDGVFVEGVYLSGARYNRTLKVVQPPRPKQMVDALPAIHFEPTVHAVRDENMYECPLYKTSERAGVLSTTGASTNFVLAIHLPTKEPPTKWIRMGVACLCATDD